MIITVDFDGCLTTSNVQEFVREAISLGHTLIVVTSRYTETISNKLYGQNESGWNSDIIKLSKELGISKIYFTNTVPKWKYIAPLEAVLHLDDDNVEVIGVNTNTNAVGLNINKADWKSQAKKIITTKKRV